MKKFLLTAFLMIISSWVFAQERIAVFPFEDMDKVFVGNEAIMFYQEFSNEFTNRSAGKFSVVPRQDVERLINTEAAFQLSDFSARSKTSEMARVLNGTQILSGRIGKLGSNLRIIVSLYTYPELVQLPGGTTLSVANKTELFNKIPELVQSMYNAIAGQNSGTSAIGTTGRTYNIGDIGPAGGIIFYDKEVFSNGWRYLEVAPVETEFTAQWGGYRGSVSGINDYYDIPGIGTVVGSGKRNTQLIVEWLNQSGESGRAVQLCASMNFDGFNDWFLPSIDELSLIYGNLKYNKNLGGFRDATYWSSSQNGNSVALVYSFINNGQKFGSLKNNTYTVRAVRAF